MPFNYAEINFGIFLVDLDDMDTLLKEYDGNLVNKVTPDNLFGLLDASSLLWRLEVRMSVILSLYIVYFILQM